MDEFIKIQFHKRGKRLPIKRRLPGGIEFDEPDPIERTVGISFDAGSDATRERMNSIRRLQGWEPGVFRLRMAVEDGQLVLRGVNEHALPAGIYKLRVQIEEAKTPGGAKTARVDPDSSDTVRVDVELDERDVEVDVSECDPVIQRVLESSRVDGVPMTDWIADSNRRPTRQACVLNVLASLRARPSLSAPLCESIHSVFFVSNDRFYAKVDRALMDRLQSLVKDPKKPFYAEGPPHASIHGQLLEKLPEPPDIKSQFKQLFSFRGEGSPSVQIVIAAPPPDLPHTYAEFDLDLGNPLQDIAGFFVHLGELIDGKPTNHLDLRKKLAKTTASRFLYYKVVAG
jgi:hypothetical protein